jgi:hypothetical protein
MNEFFTAVKEFFAIAPYPAGAVIIAYLYFKNKKESIKINVQAEEKDKTDASFACRGHASLEKQIAVMLEKIEQIHQWQKDNSIWIKKDIEELFNRLRRVESRVSVLEAVNKIIDDDTKI